jgi:hypothetical protein
MNRDEVMRMAREVELFATTSVLIKFANLVAAAEREACAKVCMEDASLMRGGTPPQIALMEAAAAIRARGQR